MRKYLRGFSKILTFIFITGIFLLNTINANVEASELKENNTSVEKDTDLIVYFPNWGIYEDNHQKLTPDKLPWDKLDIINHSFFSIDKNFKLTSIDSYSDYEINLPHSKENGLAGCMGEYKYYTSKYPDVKVMISVGGWTRGENFHDMAKTPETRKIFIQSCIDFMEKYPFISGMDLDWEYPGIDRKPEPNNVYDKGCPGGPEDTKNYTALIKEMREQFDAAGMRDKWITVCGPAGRDKAKFQELDIIHQYVNKINLMTYDIHGNWENITGHHSNLTVNPDDPSPTEPVDVKNEYNVLAAAEMYINEYNVPAEKMTIGTPWYSRGWAGVDPNTGKDGMFAQTDGSQFKGNWDEVATPSGQEAWFSLKQMENNNGWTKYRDEYHGSPWLYNKEKGVVLTYEDEYSMQLKCELIRRLGLGGMIVWEITGDDVKAGYPMTTLLDKELDKKYVYDPSIKGDITMKVDSDNNFGSFDLQVKIPLFSDGKQLEIYENNKLIDTISVDHIKGGLETYNITNKAPGKYEYKCILKNESNKKESNLISVNVQKPDLLEPSIEIDLPENRGNYKVKGISPKNSSANIIELYENNKLIESKEITATLNKDQKLEKSFTNKADGIYSYKVVVKDKEGNIKESKESSVKVDKNTPIMPSDIDVKFKVTSDWGSGANYRLEITNNSLVNITDYKLEFTCNKKIQNCWGAGSFKADGNKYTLTPQSWNTGIPAGKTIILDGSMDGGADNAAIDNVKISYEYDGQITPPKDPELQNAKIEVDNEVNYGQYNLKVTVPKNNLGNLIKIYEDNKVIKEVEIKLDKDNDIVIDLPINNKAIGEYDYKVSITDGKTILESKSIKVSVKEKGTATEWAPYVNYKEGDVVSYKGIIYECRQPHLSLNGWEPSNIPALWAIK